MNNTKKSPTRLEVAPSADGTTSDTNHKVEFFDPPTYSKNRKQALADGLQIQVSPEFAKKMREDWDLTIPIPMFLTKNAIETCESVSQRRLYDEDKGALWHIFCVLDNVVFYPLLGRGTHPAPRIPITVYFGTSQPAPHVNLHVLWSTVDVDDPRSTFTVMLPTDN